MRNETENGQWTIIQYGKKNIKCRILGHKVENIIHLERLAFFCFRCDLIKRINPMKIGYGKHDKFPSPWDKEFDVDKAFRSMKK